MTSLVHDDCCCSYQGEWRNDQKHGDGEAVSADGRTVYKGRFVRGERSGKAKLLLVVSDLSVCACVTHFIRHNEFTRFLACAVRCSLTVKSRNAAFD